MGLQEKSIKRHNPGILFSYLLLHNVHNTTNEHGMICFTCGTFYDTNFFF